jgi:hypothetical protein
MSALSATAVPSCTYSYSVEEIKEHGRTVSFALYKGVHTPPQSEYFFLEEELVREEHAFQAYLRLRRRMEAIITRALIAGEVVTSVHDYSYYGRVMT